MNIAPMLHAKESTKPITIVGTNYNLPFSHTLPDGTVTGLYVEFWQLWSKTNNIPINIVLTTLDDSLHAVQNGGMVHAGLFVNDDRKQWADFSLPIHSVDTGILYNRKFPSSTKLVDINGLKVTAQEHTFQSATF